MSDFIDEIELLSTMKYCRNCMFYFEDASYICPECEEDVRVEVVEETEEQT